MKSHSRRYIYDGRAILVELEGAAAVAASCLHGPGIDESLAMVRGGAEYRYFGDLLGSVTKFQSPPASPIGSSLTTLPTPGS